MKHNKEAVGVTRDQTIPNQTATTPRRGPPSISIERLIDRLTVLSQITATPGEGITRLAFSPEDKRGRELFITWLTSSDLSVREDQAGNIFGRAPGKDPGAAPMLLGSHLDTVPQGGAHDGALGCIAALEVLTVMSEAHLVPACPVDVVVWADEEGCRFGGGFLGSQIFTHTFPAESLARTDGEGVSYADALQSWGLDPLRVETSGTRTRGYLELHIEQGPTLERLGIPVGIVQGIVGMVGLELHLEGRAGHAGTTPMDARSDPLLAAAEIALACEAMAQVAGNDTVATVGTLRVEPGASNVIPGACDLSVDIRSGSEAGLQQAERGIRDAIDDVMQRRRIRGRVNETLRLPPIRLAPRMQDALSHACSRAGVPIHRMHSGAGHDAMILAHVTEAGMLFVRCRGGVSHNPAEYAAPEDIRTGTQILLDAVIQLTDAAPAL
jgi:allantoate deiminase